MLYFAGYGLKCYECKSEKSWADCAKSEVDCPAVNDITCVKAYGEGKVAGESRKAFAKGVSLNHCATMISARIKYLGSHSPSVISTAATVICVMEPRYQ